MGMEMPIMHESDRYELVKDIGSGNFGVARLMRDKISNGLVAVKYIERGQKVSLSFSPFLYVKKIAFFGFWVWDILPKSARPSANTISVELNFRVMVTFLYLCVTLTGNCLA